MLLDFDFKCLLLESGGSDDEHHMRPRSGSTASQKEKYFWQYNIQAKGPKGQRLILSKKEALDPHVLDQVVDPVFNPSISTQGIRHR
jgi:hypothetical protein